MLFYHKNMDILDILDMYKNFTFFLIYWQNMDILDILDIAFSETI